MGEGAGGSRVSPAAGSKHLGTLVRGWLGEEGPCVGLAPCNSSRAGGQGRPLRPGLARLHLVPQASQSPACGWWAPKAPHGQRVPSTSGRSRSKVGGWGPDQPSGTGRGAGRACLDPEELGACRC